MLTWDEKVKQNRIYEVLRYVETLDENNPCDIYSTSELTLKEATTLYNALYLQDGIVCVKLVKEGWDEDEVLRMKEV